MTNFETDEEIKIENEKLEKVESYNYLGQITTTNRKSEDEIKERIRKVVSERIEKYLWIKIYHCH